MIFVFVFQNSFIKLLGTMPSLNKIRKTVLEIKQCFVKKQNGRLFCEKYKMADIWESRRFRTFVYRNFFVILMWENNY